MSGHKSQMQAYLYSLQNQERCANGACAFEMPFAIIRHA